MKEKTTGYPSVDKTHLKNLKYFERHPYIPNISISNAIDIMYSFKGSLPVFDCLDLRITHKEFKEDADIVSRALVALGIKPGDIICISLPNLYQAIVAFKAANRIGAIATFLNPFASDTELLHYLELYNSPILFNYDRDEAYNERIIKESKLRHVITLESDKVNDRSFDSEGNNCDLEAKQIMYHELGKIASKNKVKYKTWFGGNQEALILYTSGSTGEPKSLLFTNENLLAAMLYLKASTHQRKTGPNEKKWMSVVPFMYPYGFCCSVLAPIFIDAEIILAPNLSQDTVKDYYAKEPYLIFGSPAFLELSKRNLPEDMKIPSLKMFVSGGDFLSVSQSEDGIQFFKEHGADVKICNGSGNGEILGCSTNSMNIPYRPETVGQLVLGPDYVVLDPKTKKEVKYGEPGVLCVSGKHVFKGYYNNPKATAETMVSFNGKQYYYTGNYGILDEDRYFTLIGRASRFYITYTLNKVYCELVQNIVSQIDVVNSCAVVPKPDKETLFKSKAYVVLKPGVEANKKTEEHIIRESMNIIFEQPNGDKVTLKPYEAPASVTFMDELPRTDSAEKIDYEQLGDLAEKEYEQECKVIQ